MNRLPLAVAMGVWLTIGCESDGPDFEPIFIDGRAVAAAGDSLLAFTAAGVPGVLLHDHRSGVLDTLGAEELQSPAHVQWINDRWYVSDVSEAKRWIVVFSSDGSLEARIDVSDHTAVPHQFAVLVDGGLVLETADDRLTILRGDSVTTFALIQASSRTGLLVAARGGVLHAVPDRTITLYNGLGKIRWRLDWPWEEGLFVTDLSVDSHGRPHLLAGHAQQDGFIVFAVDPLTGEVVQWMEGPTATFSVRRYGAIRPDDPARWLGQVGG